MILKLSARSLSLACALGAYGGAVLSLSSLFLTPGKYVLIPYAAVVMGLTLAIRAERMTQFAERYLVALLAFMIASLTLYVTVSFQAHTAVTWGHTWRIAFLLLVGLGISLPAAVLGRPLERAM
jgi:membrane-bound acyltransferase YfiQ involved in biofilm formation